VEEANIGGMDDIAIQGSSMRNNVRLSRSKRQRGAEYSGFRGTESVALMQRPTSMDESMSSRWIRQHRSNDRSCAHDFVAYDRPQLLATSCPQCRRSTLKQARPRCAYSTA
jgi:hypothetical protein